MERPWSPGSPGRPAVGDALAQRKRRANLQKQMKFARDSHAEKIEADSRESVFNPTPGGQTLRPLWRPSTANGPWEQERGRIEVKLKLRSPTSCCSPAAERKPSTNCMELTWGQWGGGISAYVSALRLTAAAALYLSLPCPALPPLPAFTSSLPPKPYSAIAAEAEHRPSGLPQPLASSLPPQTSRRSASSPTPPLALPTTPLRHPLTFRPPRAPFREGTCAKPAQRVPSRCTSTAPRRCPAPKSKPPTRARRVLYLWYLSSLRHPESRPVHAACAYTFPYVSPPGVLGHDDLVHQVFADHRVCLSLPRPPSALTLTLPRYSSVGFHPSSALLSYGEPTVSRPNAQQFMKGNSKVKITILFYKLTIGITTPLLPLFARQHHALHTIRLNAFSLLVPLATSLVVCFTKLYAAPHRTTNATSSFSPLHSFMACRRVRSLTSLCTPCFGSHAPPCPLPYSFARL